MTHRQILTLIIATWTFTGAVALLLHILTSGGAEALLDDPLAWPHLSYALSLIGVMSTILSCFYLLRHPQLRALSKVALLAVPSLLAVVHYYLFLDSGLLACLPVLAVVSVMMLTRARI